MKGIFCVIQLRPGISQGAKRGGVAVMNGLKRLLLSVIVISVVMSAGVAAAVEATTTPTAPVASGDVEVQLWMAAKPSEAVVIVSIELPESVELPATVQLPLVEGMTVDWAGEISGGDPTQDPPRAYTTKTGPDGGTYVEFVMSQYRVGQVDLSGKPHSEEGFDVSASFDYIQPLASGEVTFTVRVPAIASDVKISPKPTGDPVANDLGETLYVLPRTQLGVGETQRIDVSYSADPSKLGGSGGDDTFAILVGGLAALVAVILVALVVVARRRGSRATGVDARDVDE